VDAVTQDDVAQQFNMHSEDYDDTTNKSIGFSGLKVDFFVRAKAEHILHEARAHFGDISQVNVLDIGCGVGKYHDLINPSFNKISGIDVSEKSIDIARENQPDVDYFVYNGAKLPFEDNSFELTYTICVMHHVPPVMWANFAQEMMRVTKPGGMALVFEHNPLNPLTRKAVNDCPYDKDAVLLRPKDVKENFSHAGAVDMKTEHILTIPAISGPLKSIDRLFGRIPLGAQYCQRILKPA
jgi:SAM-dependent methyltransferase